MYSSCSKPTRVGTSSIRTQDGLIMQPGLIFHFVFSWNTNRQKENSIIIIFIRLKVYELEENLIIIIFIRLEAYKLEWVSRNKKSIKGYAKFYDENRSYNYLVVKLRVVSLY